MPKKADAFYDTLTDNARGAENVPVQDSTPLDEPALRETILTTAQQLIEENMEALLELAK